VRLDERVEFLVEALLEAATSKCGSLVWNSFDRRECNWH
jgi:hypothetical protein